MYDKTNLVIAKKNFSRFSTSFNVCVNYRCLIVEEGDQKEFMVFGVVFDQKGFNKHFVFLHDVVMKEWAEIGLITEQGKAISKTAFGKLIDVRTYGKGKTAIRSGFFGHPKKFCYQFTTNNCGDNKKELITQAYKDYLEILNGNVEPLEGETVIRGNSGYPLAFSHIYWSQAVAEANKKVSF